jgi:hypothetical protein
MIACLFKEENMINPENYNIQKEFERKILQILLEKNLINKATVEGVSHHKKKKEAA